MGRSSPCAGCIPTQRKLHCGISPPLCTDTATGSTSSKKSSAHCSNCLHINELQLKLTGFPPDRRRPGCPTTRVKPARWPRKAEAGRACPRRGLGPGWTCRSRAAKHRQGGQRQGKRTGQSCSTHPQVN